MYIRFTVLLDARKTGHVVKPDVYDNDKTEYKRDPPPCMAKPDHIVSGNPNHLRRSEGLPKFILDELLAAGKDLQTAHLCKYDELGPHSKQPDYRDEDILNVSKRCADLIIFQTEMFAVEGFVEQRYTRWKEIWAHHNFLTDKRSKRIADNQKLRSVIADFVRGPDAAKTPNLRAVGMLDSVAASYAYKKNPKFGFAVAFRELATIKAKACGLAPTAANIAATMTVSSSAARILSRSNISSV